MGDGHDAGGGRFYDDPDGLAAYLAHRHSGTGSPNTVMEEPAFVDVLGSLQGQRVLDLGCGDGSFSAHVLRAGAAGYVGIDASSRMIDLATQAHGSDGARFQVGDIEALDTDGVRYDVVTSRMALHYVADLESALAGVHRALVPGGRLVMSVVHPVITSHDDGAGGPRTSWTVDDYFVPGPRRRAWFGRTVTWYHRTVEQHVEALTANGFTVTTLRECEPDARLLAEVPDELARRRRVPLMLLLAATARDVCAEKSSPCDGEAAQT